MLASFVVTTKKLGNVKLWLEGKMLLLAGLDNFCIFVRLMVRELINGVLFSVEIVSWCRSNECRSSRRHV